ncbi:MAG: hypothetical protein WC294_00075 [Methanoregula sp.]|jgi:hypothetical protein
MATGTVKHGAKDSGEAFTDLNAGSLTYKPTYVDDSETGNILAANMLGQVHRVTGNYTRTLPAGFAGASATFYATTASTFSLKPQADELIRLFGTALDVGDKISSVGTEGDEVTIFWDSAGYWRAHRMNVLFTDTGA